MLARDSQVLAFRRPAHDQGPAGGTIDDMTRVAILACALAMSVGELPAQRDLTEWSQDPWRTLAKLPVASEVPDGHLVRVHLLSGDHTNPPIANANVYVLPEDCIDKPTRTFLFHHFRSLQLAVIGARYATRYQTGADGTVRVAMPKEGQSFAVTSSGFGIGATSNADSTIMLAERGRVLVEAVDCDGRPVHGVALYLSYEHGGSQLANACTNKGGRADLRFVAARGQDQRRRLQVVAAVAGPTRIACDVPADYFEDEPRLLRVQLPPVGSVLLRTDTISQHLKGQKCTSFIQWTAPPGSFAGLAYYPNIKWTDEGALFTHVALNEQFEARVIVGDGRWFNAKGSGPTKRGALATLTATPRSTTWEVTGRLLDVDGKPIAEFDGTAFIYREEGWFACRYKTAADGTFRIDTVVTDDLGGPLHFEFRSVGFTLDGEQPAAVADVAKRQDGKMALGDLIMRREPVMVSARVLDLDDKPVAGLLVFASPTHMNRGGIGSLAIPPSHRAETDAAGRFSFYEAEPASGPLKVTMRSSSWKFEKSGDVTVGSKDEVLRVRPVGLLKVRIADPQMAGMLRAELFQAGRSRGRSRALNRRVFQFSGLTPGEYEVRFSLANREVLRIEKIHVLAGVDQVDSRLREIDWLAKVKVATVHVTGTDGKPISAEVRVRDGVHLTSPLPCDALGIAKIAHLPEQVLEITHPRFRSQFLQSAEAAGKQRIEVRMLPRARLHLKLPSHIKLPADTRVLMDNDEQPVIWRQGGPTVVMPGTTGKTELTVMIFDEGGNRRELHRQTVVLRDDAQLTDVMLKISPEVAAEAAVIAEAVRKMRRRV